MRIVAATLFVAVFASLGAWSEGGELPPSPWSVPLGFGGVSCAAATSATPALPDLPTNYYGIEMVPTKRVPGTGAGTGVGRVTFAGSPFGVSVSKSGTYRVDIALKLDGIKKPKRGVLTAWATKDDLSETLRLGALDDAYRVAGTVNWNKFLLVVTLEPSAAELASWSGPVVMRGMSRSGLMHTLAGHGPFEQEPCSKYGF